MQVVSTYLERDTGNTKNSLCNWVRLPGVSVLLVLCEHGTTDLCEARAMFIDPVHGPLSQSAHQWGVFL